MASPAIGVSSPAAIALSAIIEPMVSAPERTCAMPSSNNRAAVQRIALGATQRLGDPAWQAGAHRGLGNCLTRMGRLDEGHRHFRHALDRYERLDDPVRQAHVHRGLGGVRGRWAATGTRSATTNVP
ncbi:tetratricopeptide repeat protein [Streptomyces indonesiensis]